MLLLLLVALLGSGAVLTLWLLSIRTDFSDQYQQTHFSPPLSSPGGAQILGISSDGADAYPGIPWLRLSYKSCGNNDFAGSVLKNLVAGYHKHGIHVLVLVCQHTQKHLLDAAYLKDAASSVPDAVECGNEQMKADEGFTTYIPPEQFARFYVRCRDAMRAVHPGIPVLMGSLDPHIVGPDTAILQWQEHYLDEMQQTMNTEIDPGGNWTWQSQRIGLNDSAHNGYPSAADNNLYQLFLFWSEAFAVPITQLGTHLWVAEGTACFTCITHWQVSHTITLITDVLTATQYHVPFFFFDGRDFFLPKKGIQPFGILDRHGRPKPLIEGTVMGSHALSVTCEKHAIQATQQEQLLAALYAGCTLPATYAATLEG